MKQEAFVQDVPENTSELATTQPADHTEVIDSMDAEEVVYEMVAREVFLDLLTHPTIYLCWKAWVAGRAILITTYMTSKNSMPILNRVLISISRM